MLNYRLFGEASSSPPLVVLHGLLGSLENWQTFARGQATKRAVLALDLRNHGDSPHVPGMSYQQMSADVVEVLAALAMPHCDLMGHSMGGKVAMTLALQHPERVQRLLVVDIAPKTYPPRHQALLQAMSNLPLTTLTSRKQADEWLSSTVNHPLERGFLLKNLGRRPDGTFFWQCNLPEIAKQYLKISGFPTPESAFNQPTLFVRGGQSDYIQDADIDGIRQAFPQAILTTLDAAGHLPHVQTPAEFSAAVNAFLD